jgi:hypothetical protein
MSMNQCLPGFSPSFTALALVVLKGCMIIADRQGSAFSYIVALSIYYKIWKKHLGFEEPWE